MTQPTLHYIPCQDANGGHKMAYWQWGNPEAAHVVVCVHGVSRQGRDFDVLAQSLATRGGGQTRVICPDIVGRGQSDWLKDPAGYQIPNYAMDMAALLPTLQSAQLDWIGTSMGGLIGMVVAGSGLSPVPIRRLVINDVGPTIQWEAVQRIGPYLGALMRFDSLEQAAAGMWAVSTGFGPHTPAQWLELSRYMVKPVGPQSAGDATVVRLHYDPAIAVPFKAVTQEAARAGEAAVWAAYDHITAQTLLLRGANSDVLTSATAQAMRARGPKTALVEFAGVGHAPTLIAPDQLKAVGVFIFAA